MISNHSQGNTSTSELTASSLLLQDLPTFVTGLQAVVLVLTIITSLSLNGCMLYLLVKHKNLREARHFNGVPTIVLDILWTLTTHPVALATTLSRKWLFGDTGCMAFGVLVAVLPYLRCLIIAITAINRFCSVFAPFQYPHHKTKLIGIFVTAALIVTAVRGLIPVFDIGLGRYSFYTAIPLCYIEWHCSSVQCYTYNAILMLVVIVAGVIIPVTAHVFLYRKGRTLAKRNLPAMVSIQSNKIQTRWAIRISRISGTNALSLERERTTQLQPNSSNCIVPPHLPPIPSSHRQGIPALQPVEKSIRYRRRQRRNTFKALKTFFLLMVQYIVFPLPFFVHFILHRTHINFSYEFTIFTALVGFAVADLFLLLPLVDCLVLLRSREVRDAWKKALCCH